MEYKLGKKIKDCQLIILWQKLNKNW
jgi:hypothetical protein